MLQRHRMILRGKVVSLHTTLKAVTYLATEKWEERGVVGAVDDRGGVA